MTDNNKIEEAKEKVFKHYIFDKLDDWGFNIENKIYENK